MMDDATVFIQDFVELDFALRNEQWTEANDQLFQSHLANLNSHYFGNIRSNINRENPVPQNKLAEGKKYLQTLQKKKIFQIKEYKHNEYYKLYCAYLSSDFIGGDDYFIKIYYSLIKDKFKIIAIYYKCFDCNGTGLNGNKECEECEGKGWVWQGGVKINIKEKPKHVVKLLKPANTVDFMEYESE